MKTKMIIYFLLISLALLLGGWQMYMAMAQNSTPQQPYRIVKKIGNIEIRFYPPAVEASVIKSGNYNAMMNGGFRDLASYIFGGNDRNETIAMTAPVIVEMTNNSSVSAKIAFVMPEDFDMDKRPKPYLSNISFEKTNPVYAAAVTFGGFASLKTMDKHTELLLLELEKAGLKPEGNVAYLYYNPPFQLLNRRNEVLVRLNNFSE